MATLGRWVGGSITAGNLPETWTAPNGLFPTENRNDSSTYTFTSSTSTVTLPASGLADGYFFVAHYEYFDDGARFNPQGKIVQASGTGTFVGNPASGYLRDASEDRAFVTCWAFVDNPSASATFQFQWKADVDDADASDTTENSYFEIIPFYYSDVGLYTSTTAALYGGTTRNLVTGFSGTDGTNITISSNQISVTGDNKRYLILSGHFQEGYGGRTQRQVNLEIDGTVDEHAVSYVYPRNTSDDECGGIIVDLIETVTATRTIELNMRRGPSAVADGAADIDGSTPSVANFAMVVLELNDDTEVWRSHDDTAGQDISNSTPVDLNIARTTDVDFNDSASFTRSSDTGVNCESDMDVLFGANTWGARTGGVNGNDGQRLTNYVRGTVNGVEDQYVAHGNYLRGEQSSTDTWGWGANPIGFAAVNSGDDIGISVEALAGSEGENDFGTNADATLFLSFWAINLDTLEQSGASAQNIDGTSHTDSDTLNDGDVDQHILASFLEDTDLTNGGTVQGGVVAIDGSLLPDIDTFNGGVISQFSPSAKARFFTYPPLPFTLRTPPAVSVQNISGGSLFQDLDELIDGDVDLHLFGDIHTDPDSINGGLIAALAVNLEGSLLQDSDTFFQSDIDLHLFGETFVDSDTLNDGDVNPEAVNLRGSLLQDIDAFNDGLITHIIEGSIVEDIDVFNDGIIATQGINISGSLLQDLDAFNQGLITHIIKGSLFEDQDIFNDGEVSAGDISVEGSVLQDPDTFNEGLITHIILGSLLEDQDLLSDGEVNPGAINVQGSLLQDLDVFNSGLITHILEGSLLEDPDTFNDGTLLIGDVNVRGSILDDGDTFNEGLITHIIEGNVFQDLDAFNDGQLEIGGINLQGQLLEDVDTFLGGILNLYLFGGSLLQDGDIFNDSLISPHNIFGSTLEDDDTLYGGSLSADIRGSTLEDEDVLSQGDVDLHIFASSLIDADELNHGTITNTIAGSILQDEDVLHHGVVEFPSISISGVLFQDVDTLFHGSLLHELFGSLFEDEDTIFHGRFGGANIEGSFLDDIDTFFQGNVEPQDIQGSLHQDPDIFYGGSISFPDAEPSTLYRIIIYDDITGLGSFVDIADEITLQDQGASAEGTVHLGIDVRRNTV